MMKRILSLFLCLMMLAGSAARAEEDIYLLLHEALYRIVLRTGEGDITLGTGVLFMQDNVLLTVESCSREGSLLAIGQDGEHVITDVYPSGDSGLALAELAEPSSATPLLLGNYDAQGLPFLFGCDTHGNLGAAPMYQAFFATYRGQAAATLSSEEGMMPGAVIVDEHANVIGLMVAQEMEGYGMYIVLDPDSIYLALTGGADTSAFLPLEMRWEEGLLTLSWTDDNRSSGFYHLLINADENDYYTTYEATPEEREITIIVPPGHTYYAQVQWVPEGAKAQALVWNAMTTCTVPNLVFSDYGFQQRCYLAAAPAGQEVTGQLPELTDVTSAILTDKDTALYLQVINTYDVSEEITVPMTVTLTDPSGQFYALEMSYIFVPEYEQNDVFAVPVDELFATCREFSPTGSLLAGEYILCYAINGQIAGECTFLLEVGE